MAFLIILIIDRPSAGCRIALHKFAATTIEHKYCRRMRQYGLSRCSKEENPLCGKGGIHQMNVAEPIGLEDNKLAADETDFDSPIERFAC